MKSTFIFLVFVFFSSQSVANETQCLGGVCLGDTVEKLNDQSWISGDQMELHNQTDLPYRGAVESFENAKKGMDSYYKAKEKMNPIYINSYLQSEKEFIEKYTVGITDEEKLSLNPYYRSRFFDNKALDILHKVIACKGKKLRGFKQTKHGNVDMVSIMPSPSTGKFEVIGIQRQFAKMDKPQKEALFGAIEKKHPSIMSRRDAHRATFSGEWDANKPILFWNDVFGVLNLTKIFRVPVIGGYGDNTALKKAIDAYGKEHDDILLRNASCSNKLAPKLDIE